VITLLLAGLRRRANRMRDGSSLVA
jgi:hypothetical protein